MKRNSVFRIRIRVDPDSNRQSGSEFGIRIRIQQLKLSFFKTVEGCTDRLGTSKHLFAGVGKGCKYHTGRNPQIFLNFLSKCLF